MWDKIVEFINASTKPLIETAILIGVAFVLFVLIAIVGNKIIKRQRNKKKKAMTLTKMIQSILRYTILILAIIVILSFWGVQVGPILAGAGIIGIVIGFGAQDLIKDLLSGFSIIFENYYDVDDVVEIKGFKGRVLDIGLKSTKLINWKNEIKVFTNGDIKDVTNFSKNPSVGVVDIAISYNENLDQVISLLEEQLVVIKDLFPQVIEGPNVIGVVNFADNAIIIRITVKTESEQHYGVERAIRKHVKEVFDENGIAIPFPQLVVYNGNNKN
ncbi:MAG: mechanosensitive ion channel family protein [Bacilli bacterium]|jgi:small conductance mechanosensitive channel|nr:mechanosensitive ion channel family protein [Bacilli bacterium]MDD3348413.1 mechanosensitive ion channel family protein [Bacilli bacterium]MDD4056583.1 mechanosensitive ion channel family protein [Bacilli bacterium]MDY0208556.1 mechanosensitive ion channel family protein [Bacilli bacterium]